MSRLAESALSFAQIRNVAENLHFRRGVLSRLRVMEPGLGQSLLGSPQICRNTKDITQLPPRPGAGVFDERRSILTRLEVLSHFDRQVREYERLGWIQEPQIPSASL